MRDLVSSRNHPSLVCSSHSDDCSLAGFGRSANYASVPLSRIRDMRFSSAGSPYRISLHLPPSVEPRWVTIIYAVPPPSNFLGSVTGGPAYKLVHFIATTGEEYLAPPQNARELPRRTTCARDLRDEQHTDVVNAALHRRGRRQGRAGSRGAPALRQTGHGLELVRDQSGFQGMQR